MENKKFEREEAVNIKWTLPALLYELGEIERTARQTPSWEGEYDFKRNKILDAVLRAELEELPDDVWAKLENTESYHDVRPGHLEDAQKYSELPDHQRDWRGIMERMKKGETVNAPIILIKPDGVPYLIGGNTRLMLCRALGVRPKVLIARIKQKKE